MDTFRKLLQRFRSSGFWPTAKYLVFTVLFEKLGIHVSVIFVQAADESPLSLQPGFHCEVIDSLDDLMPPVREALTEYGGEAMIEDFAKSFAGGQKCALGFLNNRFGCACWFQRQKHSLIAGQPVYLIWRCFTLPAMRGHRLYPLTLFEACTFIRRELNFHQPIIIESSMFNKSSIRGIEKAGFKPVSKKIEIGRWSRFY